MSPSRVEAKALHGMLVWRMNKGKSANLQRVFRIASYINNVHPILHSPIYKVTEKLIDILIPLFNRTLIDLKAPGYRNQRIHLAELGRDLFINREPYPFRPPEQRSYDKYLDAQKRYQDFIFVDLKKEFWNAGVQMVMQLQDVNLSPDNPEYDGQEWHVHGQNVRSPSLFWSFKLLFFIRLGCLSFDNASHAPFR